MKRACMRRLWTFISMREFFTPINSPVDGNQHLSEVVFSALVRFSLYTTNTHYRVKESPKSTTGMSSVAYVMLCGTRDRSCGQQAIGASITTMLQHIPRTWFRLFFSKKPDSWGSPGSLLSWYGSLWLMAVPRIQEAIKESDFRQRQST